MRLSRQHTNGSDLPTAILASMHKAGSTFLAGNFTLSAIAMYPGLRVMNFGVLQQQGLSIAEHPLPPQGVLAIRVYPEMFDDLRESPDSSAGRFSDKKIVMVVRDPRDVAVSLYYSLAYSHTVPPGNSEAFLRQRSRLQKSAPIDAIRSHTAKDAIREFRACVAFMKRYPHTLHVPYRLMVNNFLLWYQRVVEYLGWHPDLVQHVGPALAADVAPPSIEDVTQHKRRVRPGNWRDIFDRDLNRYFESEVGDDMRAAGYGDLLDAEASAI